MVTHAARRLDRAIRAPQFPDRAADTYARQLRTRVHTAHLLLLGKLAKVLKRLTDIDERAKARRADTGAEDIAALIRVVDQVQEAFEKAFVPDQDGLAGLASIVDTFTTGQTKKSLRTVFAITPAATPQLEALHVTWAKANAELITTLDAKYFDDISKSVREAVASGRTTKELAAELQERYNVSARHAKFLARDQVAKLNAAITQQRQTRLGIAKYRWSTSNDERVRDTHRANAERDIGFGAGVYEWKSPPDTGHPGQDYQCFPAEVTLSLLERPIAATRRRYLGPALVVIDLGDGSRVRCTPNHPILTSAGWTPAGTIGVGDLVATLSRPHADRLTLTAGAWFDLLAGASLTTRRAQRDTDFHGDGSAHGPFISMVTSERTQSPPIRSVDADEVLDPDAQGDLGIVFAPVTASTREELGPTGVEVHNVQTASGWYVAGGLVVRNCRCVSLPVLDDLLETGPVSSEGFVSPIATTRPTVATFTEGKVGGATGAAAKPSAAVVFEPAVMAVYNEGVLGEAKFAEGAVPIPARTDTADAPTFLPDAVTALEIVEDLPRGSYDFGYDLAIPFPLRRIVTDKAVRVALKADVLTTTISVASMVATQNGVSSRKVSALLRRGYIETDRPSSARGYDPAVLPPNLPLVVQQPDGRYAIIDGHHRCASAFWGGAGAIRVNVYQGPTVTSYYG